MWRKYGLRLVLALFCFTTLHCKAETLNQVVRYTVRDNPQVSIRSAQEKESREDIWENVGTLLPSFNASLSAGREKSRNSSTNFVWKGLSRHDTDFNVTENIFNGFRSFYSIKASRAQYHASDETLKQSAQDLALNSIGVYLNILRSHDLVVIARKNVEVHKKTFRIISRRVVLGQSSRSEKELASGRYSVAEADLFYQLKDQKDAVSSYVEVVGQQPHDLAQPSAHVPYSDVTLQDAINSALSKNPEMQLAKYNIIASTDTYHANRSTFYPSVDFDYTRYRGKNIAGIEGPLDNNVALVKVSWNLFRGGSDYAVLQKAAYRRAAAEDEEQRLDRELVDNTTQAYNALYTANEALPKYKNHMNETVRVLAAYRKQYSAGKRTLLDVLNVENELYRSRERYITLKYDIIFLRYALVKEMGLLLPLMHISADDMAHYSRKR